MLDTQAERNALLAAFIASHGDLVVRRSKRDEDDMQAILLKLLTSSPDFKTPELAAYEIGQIDARIEAVKEKLARSSEASKRHGMLLEQLGKLTLERDSITAGPWVRTVLGNMAKDRWKTEANRARILEAHSAELQDKYGVGTGPSAEAVYIRMWEDADVRSRIKRLPPKLAVVAGLLYDDWSYREIAQILGITEPAVRKRAQSIRSHKIRAVLGL